MKKQQKEIPKGYKETKLGLIPKDWEEINIGELFEFKNGLNKGKEFFGYGTPIINYMDVYSNAGLDKSNVKGLVSLNEKEILRFSARKGDVFFTRTSETQEEIGYAACLLEDIPSAVFSGFVLRARPINKKTNLHFRKYCFSSNTVRHEIKRKSSFTTRALTNGRFLSEVLLPLPPIPEQKKIAAILSTWDKAIEKTELLIDKLKDRKKGVMQQLLTGKKRLPGFTEEWKETSLNELGKKSKGKNVELNKTKDGEPYIGSEAFSGEYKLYSNDKTNSLFCKEDDILILWDGSKAGKTVTGLKGIVGSTVVRIRLNNSDNKFINFILEMNKNKIMAIREGSGIPHVPGDFMKWFILKIPKLKEQNRISNLIHSLEQQINNRTKQRIKLVEQKKALMQQLLTGKVRVKI